MAVKIREKKNKSGKTSLYLDIYYKGKRSYEFLNLFYTKDSNNKKQIYEAAEQIRAKKELELVESDYNLVSSERKKQDFLEYCKKSFSRNSSYAAIHRILSEFHNSKKNNGILTFSRITDNYLEDFKEYLLTQVSQNTASSYWALLKAIFNRAIKEKIIQTNPAKFISIKKLETEKSFLTENELRLLAETETRNEEVKRGFIFSCYTGLRISDVKKLKWKEINENKIQFRQKKTKSIEYLPLNQTAQNIINEQRKNNNDSEYVFNIPPSTTMQEIFSEWIESTGIHKKLTFHTARHTFATLSLTSGTDIYTVSKLLGHKNIATTQIYAKIVNDSLDTAVNNLPNLEIQSNDETEEHRIREMLDMTRQDEDRLLFEFFNKYQFKDYLYLIEDENKNSTSSNYIYLKIIYDFFDWKLFYETMKKKIYEWWNHLDTPRILKTGFLAAPSTTYRILESHIKPIIFDALFLTLMKATNTKLYTSSLMKQELIISEIKSEIENINESIEEHCNQIIHAFNRQHLMSTIEKHITIYEKRYNEETKQMEEVLLGSEQVSLTEEQKRSLENYEIFKQGQKLKEEKQRLYKIVFKKNDEFRKENNRNDYSRIAQNVARIEGKLIHEKEHLNFYRAFHKYKNSHNLNSLEDFEKFLST